MTDDNYIFGNDPDMTISPCGATPATALGHGSVAHPAEDVPFSPPELDDDVTVMLGKPRREAAASPSLSGCGRAACPVEDIPLPPPEVDDDVTVMLGKPRREAAASPSLFGCGRAACPVEDIPLPPLELDDDVTVMQELPRRETPGTALASGGGGAVVPLSGYTPTEDIPLFGASPDYENTIIEGKLNGDRSSLPIPAVVSVDIPRSSKPIGWLVVISGCQIGRAYELVAARTRVGRLPGLEIFMKEDLSISRKVLIIVEYNPISAQFHVAPNMACPGICELNEKALLKPAPLVSGDVLRLSASTMLRFVAFCDSSFRWEG